MDFSALETKLYPLLQNHKNTAVMISGGFDSGLLLHSCVSVKLKYNLDTKITAITVPRYDDSYVHSNRIVEWINRKFDQTIEIVKSGNPDLHHSQQTWSGVTDQMQNFDLILMGCTTNPPHLSNGPLRPKVVMRKVQQPLYHLTKKDTVKLAIDLGLTDLMELSHTCTDSKNLRCGECWQCRERAWGFEVNNYIDPGTM